MAVALGDAGRTRRAAPALAASSARGSCTAASGSTRASRSGSHTIIGRRSRTCCARTARRRSTTCCSASGSGVFGDSEARDAHAVARSSVSRASRSRSSRPHARSSTAATGFVCALLAALDPVPHLLRAGDADVRARGVPLARRRVVVCRRDPPRAAAVAGRCSRADVALMSYATTGGSSSASASPSPTAAFARDRLTPVRARGTPASRCSTRPGCPTLLSQAQAHRSTVVDASELPRPLPVAPGTVLGGDAPFVALVLVGGAGARRRRSCAERTQERQIVLALTRSAA